LIQNDSTFTLKNITNENDALKKQLNELRNQFGIAEQEFTKRANIYEQNQAGLKRENDDLRRSINEYESKYTLISREKEDINRKRLEY